MATRATKAAQRTARKTTRKTARKVAPRKAAAKKTAKKTVARKAAAKKAPARKTARKAARRRITPAQALANTRKLLEAKQAHDREAPPWQALEGGHGTAAPGGLQAPQARDQANALHAAESHMDAIHGASGAQDRHNQGRRDQR